MSVDVMELTRQELAVLAEIQRLLARLDEIRRGYPPS